MKNGTGVRTGRPAEHRRVKVATEDEKKRGEQNAALHAICCDISMGKRPLNGE